MNKGLLVTAGILGGAALIYLESSLAFVGRFPFRTSVNGQDVSLQSVSTLTDRERANAQNYTLTVTGRNGLSDTISAKEISMTEDAGKPLQDLAAQRNIFTWPTSLLQQVDYTKESTVTFDPQALSQAVQSLTFFEEGNVIAPTDASYTLENGQYTVVPEDNGAELDADKTLAAITTAIQNEEPTLDLDESGCYKTPAITADSGDLNGDIGRLNQYVAMEVTIPIGPEEAGGEKISADLLSTWVADEAKIALAEAGKAAEESGQEKPEGTPTLITLNNITFDEGMISQYVKDLAEKYNTYGIDREFKTHDGDTITVPGGNYGWWIDQDSTKKAIEESLASGQPGTVEPVYYQEAIQWPTEENGNSDIPDTYAEVNLDDQHVWIWVDGEVVVDTACVSGKVKDGHTTPPGTFALAFKQKGAVLRGDDYETPVRYWMPFNLGIGFHDAYWRSSFGGNLYVTGGSHGCVNLPPSKAEEVYTNVSAGMPVIVYGGVQQNDAMAYVKNNKIAGTYSEAQIAAPAVSSSTPVVAADNTAEVPQDQAAAEAAQAQTDAAQDQLQAAATAAATQVFDAQIAAGASQDAALAAAQQAANAVVAGASQ